MPQPQQINIGVIGLGFMGSTHIAAWAAAAKAGYPCKLAAVADSSRERLSGKPTHGNIRGAIKEGEAAAALLFDPKEVKPYERAEELLADPDVHLVSICTPTDTHVDLAIVALRAGKHVIVEKPIAVKSADVKRLADAARDCGRICLPAMCMRFWPAWRWLKLRIDDGAFGRIRTAVFQRLGSAPAWTDFYADTSRSGGALTDLHIHDADFIYHCFGPPASVSSAGSHAHVLTQYRYDDPANPGPALVAAEGGWGHDPAFGFKMRYIVNFEGRGGRGGPTADFDLAREPGRQLLLHQNGESRPVNLGEEAGGEGEEWGGLTGYDVQVRHILDLVTGKTKQPLATLDEAVEVARLLEAERHAIAHNGSCHFTDLPH